MSPSIRNHIVRLAALTSSAAMMLLLFRAAFTHRFPTQSGTITFKDEAADKADGN